MKRIVPFVFIAIFALVFIISFMPAISESRYGQAMNIAGQVGMGISILVFFIIPGRKEPPKSRGN